MKKLFAVLLFAGLLFGAEESVQNPHKEAHFEVTTVEGQKLHFTITPTALYCDEARDKVLILDFFGKDCPPCRKMIPVLGKVQKEMADRVQIIGLHVQKPLSKEEYAELKALGIDYPVVDMLADQQNMLFVEYLGYATGWNNGIPYMLFFDRLGRYRANHYGMLSEDVLKKAIDQLYTLRETQDHNSSGAAQPAEEARE